MIKEKTRILTQLQSFRAAKPGPFWASVGIAGVSLFGMVAAFGTAPSTSTIDIPQQTIVEHLTPTITPNTVGEDNVFSREERIQHGDTVANLLARLGIQDAEAFNFLRDHKAAQPIFQQLRPGKTVTAQVSANGDLHSLSYPLNDNALVLRIERVDGQLQIHQQALQLEMQVQMRAGEIRQTLFGATDVADVPDGIATQMAEIFGGDIDFHRDLRRGDQFAVVYETFNHRGKLIRTGRILAAEFINNGKTYRAAWFENADGKGDYYSPDGKSRRKAFLRSPLEFSRISSGFTTARFHPILQTWRAHKGVDYAAPTGTRIKSTSDGTVDFIGTQGGYGKVIILRHQNRYTTLYGHLSGFAPGLQKGSRVSQGDVIGFVGSTGWATGAHLHYEFRINDVHQNPLSVALPTSIPLNPQQITQFQDTTRPYLARLELVRGNKLAFID